MSAEVLEMRVVNKYSPYRSVIRSLGLAGPQTFLKVWDEIQAHAKFEIEQSTEGLFRADAFIGIGNCVLAGETIAIFHNQEDDSVRVVREDHSADEEGVFDVFNVGEMLLHLYDELRVRLAWSQCPKVDWTRVPLATKTGMLMNSLSCLLGMGLVMHPSMQDGTLTVARGNEDAVTFQVEELIRVLNQIFQTALPGQIRDPEEVWLLLKKATFIVKSPDFSEKVV
jgi:hypothetical protein